MREENYDVAKLRNIRTIFEPEKYYYKPLAFEIIILNMKVTGIKIRHDQLSLS